MSTGAVKEEFQEMLKKPKQANKVPAHAIETNVNFPKPQILQKGVSLNYLYTVDNQL